MSYTPDQLLKIATKYVKIASFMDDEYDRWLMAVKSRLERRGLSIMDFDEDQLRAAFDRWVDAEADREYSSSKGEKTHDPWGKEVTNEINPGNSSYELMRPERFGVTAPKKSEAAKKKVDPKKKADPKDKIKTKSTTKSTKVDTSSKKKKKSSEYYDGLLNKYSQTTWNQAEQGDEDAKNFMANPTPAAPVDKTYSPTTQKLDADFVTNLQKFLLSQKIPVGPTGADGKFGNFTSQALKKWQQNAGLSPTGQTDEATMKALTPLMQAQGLLPKTDAPGAKFDHKATNETLNAISALLTQYQSSAAQGQITAANVDPIVTTLGQYETRLNEVRGQLAAFNVDPNMTPEQAGLLKGLFPKAEKLATDIAAWKQYLGNIKAKGNPAARM